MSKGFVQTQKSWADTQGIRTGTWGEIVEGITIDEKNRATVFERFKAGIQELQQYLFKNYTRKGVHAVLFGIEGGDHIQYAVFVEDGFIRNTED